MDMYLEKLLMQVEEKYPSEMFSWIDDFYEEKEDE